MDIFGWKRWKMGEGGGRDRFEYYLTGRVWTDFWFQEIGKGGRFDCNFFFFLLLNFKHERAEFLNKLIIQVSDYGMCVFFVLNLILN